ncbi:hypothetical protein EJ110_NYTH13500 [Nymphaea thermarum]|nr:hypothetical protein EJ110_NYTH13500 [Nymphaea thermarum]
MGCITVEETQLEEEVIDAASMRGTKPELKTVWDNLMCRFEDFHFNDFNVQLTNLTQTGSVLEYQHKFESLSCLVTSWNDEALVVGCLIREQDPVLQLATDVHRVNPYAHDLPNKSETLENMTAVWLWEEHVVGG